MAENDVLQQVGEWLDRQGYVLEMEVAQQLLPHCKYADPGHHYVDTVTGKVRETDLVCAWSRQDGKGVEHSVNLVVECKNTTAPWVLFRDSSIKGVLGTRPTRSAGSLEDPEDCESCGYLGDELTFLDRDDAVYAYAITEKRSGQGTDHAREAVLSVVSASLAVMRESTVWDRANPVHNAVEMFPLVVTRSPLVSCELDPSGQVKLSRVTSCWIRQAHEASDYPVEVRVINLDHLGRFIREFTRVMRTCRME